MSSTPHNPKWAQRVLPTVERNLHDILHVQLEHYVQAAVRGRALGVPDDQNGGLLVAQATMMNIMDDRLPTSEAVERIRAAARVIMLPLESRNGEIE